MKKLSNIAVNKKHMNYYGTYKDCQLKYNIEYKCSIMQFAIQYLSIAIIHKLTLIAIVHKKRFLLAVVQTKVINFSSANKSCLLQVVHTKALTQFCDPFLVSFFQICNSKSQYCISLTFQNLGLWFLKTLLFYKNFAFS